MFGIIPFSHDEKNLTNFFRRMDREFTRELERSILQIKSDVLDKGDHYILRAELPGFEKEDIHLDVLEDCLTVWAEHKGADSAEHRQFVRRERHYGAYLRQFDVSGIDTDNISAKYCRGILELRLPKKQPPKPEESRITIE